MLKLFRAELDKYLLEVKTYYPDQIVDMVVKYILFATFFYGFVYNVRNSTAYYVAYMYWIIASSIISELSMSISFEKQVGTIEQLIIKPYPFWLILTVKTYVVLLITALKGALLFAIIRITLPISLVFNINLVWILLVSVIGFTGVGLALSGLTMKFAKTASFESIISYGLLFFSGTIIPFDKMPMTVQRVLNVIPFTAGINASQKLLDGNSQVLYVLLWLLLINLACFVIGYFVFNAFFRNVKTNGVLNNY